MGPAAREAGYEIHVTALKTGDGDRVREEGFQYHALAEQDRGNNPGAELCFLLRRYRLLRALQPDLVHFSTRRSVMEVTAEYSEGDRVAPRGGIDQSVCGSTLSRGTLHVAGQTFHAAIMAERCEDLRVGLPRKCG